MIKHILVAGAMVVGGLALTTGTAAARADVKITKHALKFGNVKYFRGKAENVELGAYGEKKNGGKYLAVEGVIAKKKFGKKVKVSGPYHIDWKKAGKGQANVGIKFMKKAGGTGSFSWDKAHSAKLKLVKFYVNEGDLKAVINKNKTALNAMKNERRKARIASEIWVAMDAQLASDVTGCAGGDIKATVKGIEVNLGGKGCSTRNSSVTIPANTTFAYLLHKVKKWNKKKGKKTTIKNMEDDQVGVR